MNTLDSFNIVFSGLKSGTYNYDFLIEHPFFAEFEFSPVKEGRIWANLVLNKQETMMVLEFTFKGTVILPCDRCLEPFDFPMNGNRTLIIKFGDKTFEETDEVLVLSRAEHKINVAQFFYEFIMLAIPYQVTHPNASDGTPLCNPEALRALEKVSSGTHDAGPDPRWDALKKLIKTK